MGRTPQSWTQPTGRNAQDETLATILELCMEAITLDHKCLTCTEDQHHIPFGVREIFNTLRRAINGSTSHVEVDGSLPMFGRLMARDSADELIEMSKERHPEVATLVQLLSTLEKDD